MRHMEHACLRVYQLQITQHDYTLGIWTDTLGIWTDTNDISVISKHILTNKQRLTDKQPA